MGIQYIKKCAAAMAAVLLAGVSANAAPMVFVGSSGNLSASASFDIVGGQLQLTLVNTSAADVMNPAEVLTAIFFSLNGNPSLSSVSAVLGAGSSVVYDAQGQPAGGVVGGEWAYGNGLSGAPLGANSGISSSGFGTGFFGAATFPGADLESPAGVDGVQYGILSAGDNTATGNGGITGSGGLIKNSVVFTLGNLPAGFSLASISNVTFQYGTSLGEPNVPVPEPTTMIAGALLLLPFAASTMRFMRRRKA